MILIKSCKHKLFIKFPMIFLQICSLCFAPLSPRVASSLEDEWHLVARCQQLCGDTGRRCVELPYTCGSCVSGYVEKDGECLPLDLPYIPNYPHNTQGEWDVFFLVFSSYMYKLLCYWVYLCLYLLKLRLSRCVCFCVNKVYIS